MNEAATVLPLIYVVGLLVFMGHLTVLTVRLSRRLEQ